MTPTPADFAASEFRRRQSLARKVIARGDMGQAQAQALLLPWLAIAAAAGADLPELSYETPVWRPEYARPDAPVGMFGLRGWQDEIRRLASWEICEPAEYRETLARARDAVLNDPRAQTGAPRPYARGILALATLLRIRPWHMREQQKEAA